MNQKIYKLCIKKNAISQEECHFTRRMPFHKKNAISQERSLNEREVVFIIPRHSEDTQNI